MHRLFTVISVFTGILLLSACAGAGITTLVSVSDNSIQGDAPSGCWGVSTNSDGRYVAFVSSASNLVSEDTNDSADIFVRDTVTHHTTRVSVSSQGSQGNGWSDHPSISADGRYVAFMSYSDNLVASDTNEEPDIFVRDTQTGQTTIASATSAGLQADGGSSNPSISADGRFIAFTSWAGNLATTPGTVPGNVFIHDRQTGETTLISISGDGVPGNAQSGLPSISGDGRYVAFVSFASNLVAADLNRQPDVFVRDRLSGETVLISKSTGGRQGTAPSGTGGLSISSGGRYMAFSGPADLTGDAEGLDRIFLHDMETGETTRVPGPQNEYSSSYPSISSNGRYVAFASYSDRIVLDEMNGCDVWVYDRESGATSTVSVSGDGTPGDGPSESAAISGDGRFVAFTSFARNLVSGDTNGQSDVFAHDRLTSRDETPPSVGITNPDTGATLFISRTSLNMQGTANDNVDIAGITWSTDQGASGNCTGTATWSADNIPLSEGRNIITVTARDSAGNTATDTLTVVRDTMKPSIQITGPTSGDTYSTNSRTLAIAGTASDGTGVTSITWSSSQGTSGACTGTTTWTAFGITLSEGQNTVTVTASDAAGNTAVDSLTVTCSDTGVRTWKGVAMVSIPVIPDSEDPKDSIGFLGNVWAAYRPDAGNWAMYPDEITWFKPTSSAPGRGFFARFAEETPVPTGQLPPQDQPVSIHLLPGWNLIGQPFISAVKWDPDAIMVSQAGLAPKPLRNSLNLVAGYAWGWRQDAEDPYTGSYYLVWYPSMGAGIEDTLEPWQAYWIRAFRECDLVLPPP